MSPRDGAEVRATIASHGLNAAMPVARDVMRVGAAVPSTALTRDVQMLFESDIDLASLPVVDITSLRPIGLINRGIFMTSLAKPFYKEIYFDKSCLVFMDKSPLIVEVGMPLEELSIQIAHGGEKVVADGFIIVSDGRFLGMGFTQEVLRVMADLHRVHSAQLARHRENLETIVLQRTSALSEARDAAEAAARAKASFLANMSHEIRTPMNAIIGMAHLMRRDTLTDRQRERLTKIDNAARHLLGIINDILDLSKIGAGRMTLNESPIDLRSVLTSVAAMLGDLAANKGLKLEIDAAMLPSGLCGDATRLTQALLNYAGNAVKFTERGSVSLRCSAVQEDEGSMLVRFEVADTGPGISAEAMARLFSAFEQADSSTTRAHGGTGLGLAITRHLAELMGGEAGGESVPGSGSRFWFTARLPRALNQEGLANDQTMPASAIDPAMEGPVMDPVTAACERLRSAHFAARILLVEDEVINREVAREFLEDAGLEVVFAANGREAVDLVSKQRFSLVLMDMQMPVMDGLEATILLRGLPLGHHVPIIAMTANAFPEDRERCFAAGMDDFVAKPFDPEGFFLCLLRWLDRSTDALSSRRNLPLAAA